VVLALVLSVGINLGLIVSLALRRDRQPASEQQVVPDGHGLSGQRGRPPRGLHQIANRLGLEGEKRQRFMTLQQQLFSQVGERRPQIARKRMELRREMVASDPDRQRIETQLEEIARLELELEKSFTRTVLDSRELLSPEQERRYTRFLATRIRFERDPLAIGRPDRRLP
jgi:Spy/CpxP family protein refolding chaperone